jgi:hypothetical protein
VQFAAPGAQLSRCNGRLYHRRRERDGQETHDPTSKVPSNCDFEHRTAPGEPATVMQQSTGFLPPEWKTDAAPRM